MRVVHDFHGGIHPPEEKSLSRPGEVWDAGLPEHLSLPLGQHIGAPAEPVVAVGDRVLAGQMIADASGFMSVPVHAPTSGTVTAIDDRPIPHPSGLTNTCIVIVPDGLHATVTPDPQPDYTSITRETLIERIRNAGIAGMGGAGFPTSVKLLASDTRPIHTLIINGTECEPYITSDDTLMRTDASGIVAGAEILSFILGCETILFAVEDNKPEAAAMMTEAIAGRDRGVQCEVVTFPTKYPSGGEKQLIEILTGLQVPSGGLPADLGIVCQNPGTAVAVKDAIIEGKPLTERIVTVTGRGVSKPGNYRVKLGTPIAHLLKLTGSTTEIPERVIHGGPMMGFALPNADVPVIKTTNCILVPDRQELPLAPPQQPCIRCGLCAEACPASLLPQQLYWYARAKDFEQLERYSLFDCIECGACSWVCPSNIPLVQYYRAGKGAIVQARQEKERSDRSRERFEARQARIAEEAAAKEAKRAARKAAAEAKAAAPGEDADPVQAAIARAKAKKASAAQAAPQKDADS